MMACDPLLRAVLDQLPPAGSVFPESRQRDWLRLMEAAIQWTNPPPPGDTPPGERPGEDGETRG